MHLLNKEDNVDAFKIGVIGGSFSLPVHPNANAWSFNVTRWLNAILSISSCNSNSSITPLPLAIDPSSSSHKCGKFWCKVGEEYCDDYFEGCNTNASSFVESGN